MSKVGQITLHDENLPYVKRDEFPRGPGHHDDGVEITLNPHVRTTSPENLCDVIFLFLAQAKVLEEIET